ncbi:MAG: type II secretion system protein [Acidobacteriota bacterium]
MRRSGDEMHERGAVLLVLVVGIVVMGILAGQVVQGWNAITTREREAEFVSRATQIAHSIQRYQADYQKLPSTMKELMEPGPKGNSRYLRKLWKDPLTGEDFVLLWLAPDGASLFRSDGKPSTSGSFGNTPGGQQPGVASNHNQASSLNLNQLTVPLGSPGYDASKNLSLLDAYKKQQSNPVGPGSGGQGMSSGLAQPFGANPELKLGKFDTGSSLLSTPGVGPIVGVATSFDGVSYMEFKGHEDYSGFEISIFTISQQQIAQQNTGSPVARNPFEMPGTPLPNPLSPEGKKLYNTDVNQLGGGKSLQPGGNR